MSSFVVKSEPGRADSGNERRTTELYHALARLGTVCTLIPVKRRNREYDDSARRIAARCFHFQGAGLLLAGIGFLYQSAGGPQTEGALLPGDAPPLRPVARNFRNTFFGNADDIVKQVKNVIRRMRFFENMLTVWVYLCYLVRTFTAHRGRKAYF